MVEITKAEAKELHRKYGYEYGSEGMLHHSASRCPKYYLTESIKAMQDLEKMRESHLLYVKQ